jgi:hypothetical protein
MAGVGDASAPRGSYGFAPHDPILCDGPAGEREFISRLRCSNGHALRGPRVGSFGGKCPDPAHHEGFGSNDRPEDLCLVDGYDLKCEGGEHACFLYFDMYHPDAPEQPPPVGLTLE